MEEAKTVGDLLSSRYGGQICRECVALCQDFFNEEDSQSQMNDIVLHKPKEIKEVLDEYVIGQEDAKKVLAVAVYNHYKVNRIKF